MAVSVAITFLFPTAVSEIGINNTFLIFSGMMILGAVYCAIDLVETKDKEKGQILHEMGVLGESVSPEIQPDEIDSLNEVEEDNQNEIIQQSKFDQVKETEHNASILANR